MISEDKKFIEYYDSIRPRELDHTLQRYFQKQEEYLPFSGEEIIKGVIQLPTKATEYGTEKELDQDIKKYIHKWLDIPPDIMQLALWNIKRSWVFDRFHTLNYLRALGDTGQGKSRFLDTLGYIHYKAIKTSGATTSAPVFRIIDKWKGTLIMDEADFKQSDESQDIIKIINIGYEKGTSIMRCDQNDAKKISFFDPFCPKILATRKSFQDKAVESRCITQVMTGTKRKDIPFNLTKEFFDEAQDLRNKLLLWRFRKYDKIDPSKNIELGFELEPRIKQITSGLSSLFGDDLEQLEIFKKFVLDKQSELIEERAESFDGQIVRGVLNLLDEGKIDISAKDIIEKENITNKAGQQVKPRSISAVLKSLGFEKTILKRVDGFIKRCIPIDGELIEILRKRYCNDVTIVTVYKETPQLLQTDGNTKLVVETETICNDYPPPSTSTVTTVTTVTRKTIRFC